MIKRKAASAVVSLILSAVLLLGQISVFAAETDSGKCGPYLEWSFDEVSGVLTVSGEGPMYNYSNFSDSIGCAPFSVYRGKIDYIVIEEGCTYIGDYAFSGLLHLVDVKFPEFSLKEIGDYAFNYCIDITRIMIPDSVTKIGNYAFTTCQNLKMISFGKGVEKIPDGVCSRAGELLAVFMTDSCKEIGTSAFFECKKLRSIDISSIEVIGANSFNTCKELGDMTFGENIKKIGENCFYGCSKIGNFEFLGTPDFVASGFAYGTAWYNEKPDGIYVICDEILLCKGVYSGSELIVPDGVKTIGEAAFSGNPNISVVKLPDGLERIDDFAFFKVSKLTSIEIPESVSFIGTKAIGYKALGSSQNELNPAFTIYGRSSAAWEYAASQGFNYECLHEYESFCIRELCTKEALVYDKCRFCSEIINEETAAPLESHSLTVTETEADCENDGMRYYECTLCPYEYSEKTEEARGHETDGSWKLIKEATCSEYGVIGIQCESCQLVLEEKLIEKTEHNKAFRIKTAPTCTVDGVYEEYCRNCKEVFRTVTETAAGHIPEESYTVVKEPLADSEGYEICRCTECGIIIEGRWFTAEGQTESLVFRQEAFTVCCEYLNDYISGNTEAVNTQALDLNCDGKLNARDSLLLKRLARSE